MNALTCRRLAHFPALAAPLLALAGCGSDPGYEHTYTVRGVILSLPGEKATQEFIVHHEEIPNYQSINGSVGMREMAMPIPVRDVSLLEGLAVGDKIELTFGERFEPDHTMGLIAVKKLASDVELALGGGAKPQAAGEETQADDGGFVSIFDGKTLAGWEGDLGYWSVQDGMIVGQSTAENPLPRNTFLIWREEVGDFELKLDFRITAGGNSGIQYRSQRVEGEAFGMQGYQADIEHGPRWTGQCYDERGRGFLAMRGESVVVEAGEKPRIVQQIGDAEELNNKVNFDSWNEYHLVVKGNRMIHFINGVKMAEVLDNDEANRELKGLIGLQMHSGPAMRVKFREIRLKEIVP